MLSAIHISNFAVVDHLELEFSTGMTALTGETGAGKSIVVDALGIALGDRVDTGVVRHGSKRAEIVADFDVTNNPRATTWLKENELDMEGECLLRRVINADSGSKAFINGRPAPLPLLRELSELLIDIHSQHAHQSLLRKNEQRQLLDNYALNDKLVTSVKGSFKEWNKLNSELNDLKQSSRERTQRLEFITFQLDELQEFAAGKTEWDEITEEHKALSHMESIQGAINNTLILLDGENRSVLTQLNHAKKEILSVSRYQNSVDEIAELLENAIIQIGEATHSLNSMAESELDPARLQWLENRMTRFTELARKHHCAPEDLPAQTEALQRELETLKTSDEQIEHLETHLGLAAQSYDIAAAALSKSRAKYAQTLGKEVTTYLTTLGMADARFECQLIPHEKGQFSAFGNEEVEYVVSANPGQPLRPLNKVASGGELSRISLAIQVATAQVAEIPCMVFDEVDVGIGGGIAEVVGSLLRKLGEQRQVLCITHQAQVAAQGHQHYLVKKSSTNKSTSTNIIILDTPSRTRELARMIGGMEITNTTLQHAGEMLANAQGKHPSHV